MSSEKRCSALKKDVRGRPNGISLGIAEAKAVAGRQSNVPVCCVFLGTSNGEIQGQNNEKQKP